MPSQGGKRNDCGRKGKNECKHCLQTFGDGPGQVKKRRSYADCILCYVYLKDTDEYDADSVGQRNQADPQHCATFRSKRDARNVEKADESGPNVKVQKRQRGCFQYTQECPPS